MAVALTFGADFALRAGFDSFDTRLLGVDPRRTAPFLTLGRVSISSSMLRLALRHPLTGRGLLAIWSYNRVKIARSRNFILIEAKSSCVRKLTITLN